MNEKLSVYGLGKLGCTMLACFAHKGWHVVGVDVLKAPVTKISRGVSPIYEPRVDELIKANKDHIKATNDAVEAALSTNVSFIIVPTPSMKNGAFSTAYAENAIKAIGTALKQKTSYHLVVMTSTVMPGDTERMKNMLEKISGKKCGTDFGMCYNPDFIALGKIVHDFLNPDMILIGESDAKAGDLLESIHSRLTDNHPEYHRMSFHNAELAKIGLNAYCTLKITYANIIGEICETMPGGEANKILDAIGADSRVGKKYFKAALGFSGPCVKPQALIQTDKGLKRIDAIQINDKVLTHKGRYRKVEKIFVRDYQGPMIKIESMGYSSKPIETTPEHPIWGAHRLNIGKKYRVANNKIRLGSTAGFGSPEFIPAYKMEHADSILMPVLNLETTPIPVLNFKTHWLSSLPARLEVTPELMKFFGFYISEGSSWRKDVKISLHEKETNIADEIINIVNKYFGFSPVIKRNGKSKGIFIKFSASNLVPYLKETFGTAANNKRAPIEWLNLPDEYLIELLRGIWYGDGSRSNGVFTYGTVSEELNKFIQLALSRFGIACNVRVAEACKRSDGVQHQRAFFLRVENGTFYPLMNKLLPDLYIKPPKGSNITWCKNGAIGYNVKKVSENFYKGPVYNLEIEEDNSYVMDWGTVHNCFPRDNRAFHFAAKKYGTTMTLSSLTDKINEYQKSVRLPNRIENILKSKNTKTLAVLGVTYKEDVTLIEESPAIDLISVLAGKGYTIRVYDPAGMEEAKRVFKACPNVIFSKTKEACLRNTSVCFIGTPWKEFKELDAGKFINLMGSQPTIFDAWGIFKGLTYLSMIDYRRIGHEKI